MRDERLGATGHRATSDPGSAAGPEELLAAERKARRSLETALEVGGNGFALFESESGDGGPRLRLRYANTVARDAFGLTSGELLTPCLPPRPAARIWGLVWDALRHPDGAPRRARIEPDVRGAGRDAAPGAWDVTVAASGPGQAVVTWRDATDEEAVRRQLAEDVRPAEHSVTHDQVTGLPNGALLRGALAQTLRSCRNGRRVAVVLATLNGLSESATRRYGADVGTGLLTVTADRLRAQLRRGDVAARIGSDTFGLVLGWPTVDVDPRHVLDRIAAKLDRPLAVRSTLLAPRSSLGLVIADPFGATGDRERDADALILQAFEAMQRSKTRGEPVVAADMDTESERERVAALVSYDVHDGALDEVFGAAAHLAATACATPYALVSFIDDDLQWIRAVVGPRLVIGTGCAGPRHLALCDLTVRRRAVVVLSDLRGDPRCTSRHVAWQEGRVFYAGAPIIDREGRAIGSLCVLDDAPRELTGSQRQALTGLADVVMNVLAARRSGV